SGRHAAAGAAAHVRGSAWPEALRAIECESPVHWISPNVLSDRPSRPPRGCFALRSTEFVSRPRIQVVQDGRTLWDGRIRRLVPGRSARLAAGWTAAVDPGGGPVRVRAVR